MSQASMPSAALCGLLCAALTGCGGGGGGGDQAAGSHVAATELAAPTADAGHTTVPSTSGKSPNPGAPPVAQPTAGGAATSTTAVRVASPYTGIYYGKKRKEGSSRVTLWVHPDGRIGGRIDIPGNADGIDQAPLAGEWPANQLQAKADVLDAAGKILGHLDLDSTRLADKQKIDATLRRDHGGTLERIALKRLNPAPAWNSRQSIHPAFIVVSGVTPPSDDGGTPLQISHDASTGDTVVRGTIKDGDREITLQARMQPTDIEGMYSAETAVTVTDRNGHALLPTTQLQGYAYAFQESDNPYPILLLSGARELLFVGTAE
jgi:hypothetical protein